MNLCKCFYNISFRFLLLNWIFLYNVFILFMLLVLFQLALKERFPLFYHLIFYFTKYYNNNTDLQQFGTGPLTHCLALWIIPKPQKPHLHPTQILVFSGIAIYLKAGITFSIWVIKDECWVGAERVKSVKLTGDLCTKHGRYSCTVSGKHI